MKLFSTCKQIRAQIRQYQSQQEQIALVPTMGHLHAGHMALIELAKARANRVIVSIFINPIQFNQLNDFEHYPRTLDDDIEKLNTCDVDEVFAPDIDELYPHGTSQATKILIPNLADILEGECRPGHFEGVCTVVCKLFNIITPNIAVFGNKDFQQLLIIRHMVEALNFDIDIIAADTVRENDGLAMSSRNTLLNREQREAANKIYCTLQDTMEQFSTNTIASLEEQAKNTLENNNFRVEYFSIRDAENLQPVSKDTVKVVILAAAWLGDIRLIDNQLFTKP